MKVAVEINELAEGQRRHSVILEVACGVPRAGSAPARQS